MAIPTARVVGPTHNTNGACDTSQKTRCEQPLRINFNGYLVVRLAQTHTQNTPASSAGVERVFSVLQVRCTGTWRSQPKTQRLSTPCLRHSTLTNQSADVNDAVFCLSSPETISPRVRDRSWRAALLRMETVFRLLIGETVFKTCNLLVLVVSKLPISGINPINLLIGNSQP